MLTLSSGIRVYLAIGNTDMRKAINGLSILVESRFLRPGELIHTQRLRWKQKVLSGSLKNWKRMPSGKGIVANEWLQSGYNSII